MAEKKSLNLKELPSLNLKTGKQTLNPSSSMSVDRFWSGMKQAGGNHPAFQLATKLHDKFPEKWSYYKKGGKVKKAKCRDGIAIRGKTKGTIR